MPQSFGIPEQAAREQALQDVVVGNSSLLGEVANALLPPLNQSVTDNERIFSWLNTSIRRGLAGRVRQINNHLTPVTDYLLKEVAGQTASVAAKIPMGLWHLDPSDPYGPAIDPPMPPAVPLPPQGSTYPALSGSPQPSPPVQTGEGQPPMPQGPPLGVTQSTAGILYGWIYDCTIDTVSAFRADQPPVIPPDQTSRYLIGGNASFTDPQSAIAAGVQATHSGQSGRNVCLSPTVGSQPKPAAPPGPIGTPAAPAVPPPGPVAPGAAPLSLAPIGTTVPPTLTHYTPLTCQPTIFPVPGSLEWCQGFDGLVQGLVNLGQQIWMRISNLIGCFGIDMDAFNKWLDSLNVVLRQAWGWAGSVAQTILAATPIPCLQEQFKGLLGDLINTVNCFGGCNATELYYVGVLKGFIKVLKNFRLGTDALAWLTVDVEVAFAPIEHMIDYVSNQLCPIEVPQPGEAIEAYLMNTAPEPQIQCWLAMRGVRWEIIKPIIDSRRDKLQVHELIQWLRRHNYSEEDQANYLRSLGWINDSERRARIELYDELPTIADHLHWLQRNVFDTDYVRDFRLMEGFEERFWVKYGPDLRAQGMKKEYAEQHYAAHWITPAPGQLLEMVYRLRPTKPGVQNIFTSDDYARVLAEQDVAPYFRPRFQEIRYQVPALGYLRDQYRSYILTDEQMQSYHQDLGYSEEDSKRFVQIDKLVRERMRAAEGHGWTPAATAKAYAQGAATEEQVIRQMATLGYTEDEARRLMARAKTDLQYTIFTRARGRAITGLATSIKRAIAVGNLSVADARQLLLDAHWPEEFATQVTAMAGAEAETSRVSKAITKLRTRFLKGDLDVANATLILQNLGIVTEAIQSYLTVWQIELTPTRKTRTATQIVGDVASGHMSPEDAAARLKNLGYTDQDSMLFLATAQARVSTRQNAARVTAERQARAAGNEMARIQRSAARQAKQLQDQVRRLQPPNKLQKWAEMGIINQAMFTQRLRSYGYDDETIERLWREACSRRNAKCS